MKFATLLVCLGTMASALVAAARYKIELHDPASVAGTELKPGSYRMELNGEKAMIQGGKQQVEAGVKLEEVSQKFTATAVRFNIVDGKYRVAEIHLGGTTTKVVFNN